MTDADTLRHAADLLERWAMEYQNKFSWPALSGPHTRIWTTEAMCDSCDDLRATAARLREMAER